MIVKLEINLLSFWEATNWSRGWVKCVKQSLTRTRPGLNVYTARHDPGSKVPRYSRCKDSQGQVYSNGVITGTYEVLNVLFVGETNDAPVRSRKAWSNRVQTTGSEIKSMYSFCWMFVLLKGARVVFPSSNECKQSNKNV